MNGVTTIKIGDEPISLRFAYPCFKAFTEAMAKDKESGKNLFWTSEGEGASLTDYAYAKLFQFAYENACLIKEIEPLLKFEPFYDWVDQHNGSEELVRVIKVWTESTITKKVIEQVDADNKKKEQIAGATESTLSKSSELVTVI